MSTEITMIASIMNSIGDTKLSLYKTKFWEFKCCIQKENETKRNGWIEEGLNTNDVEEVFEFFGNDSSLVRTLYHEAGIADAAHTYFYYKDHPGERTQEEKQ